MIQACHEATLPVFIQTWNMRNISHYRKTATPYPIILILMVLGFMLLFRNLANSKEITENKGFNDISEVDHPALSISGIDGTNDFVASVCPGNALCFDVFTDLVSEDQSILMKWDNSIPGASFTTEGKSAPVGHFCWTPGLKDARDEAYHFTVYTSESSNPEIVRKSRVYSIFVVRLEISSTVKGVSCFGQSDGKISLTVKGGEPPYSFSWSNPSLNSALAENLTGGMYSVQISDDLGCSVGRNYFISEPKPIEISTQVYPTECKRNTGSVEATVTGGAMPYRYSWSPEGGNESIANQLKAGWHTLYIEDANGCMNSSQVKVPGTGLELSLASMNSATCEDSEDGSVQLSLSGNNSAYSLHWEPEVSSSLHADHLSAGNYTVSVTEENGCSFFIPISLGYLHALPVVDLGGDREIPEGTGFTLKANGGYAGYLWSDNSSDDHLEVKNAGTYSVLVTDEFGCQSIDAVELRKGETSNTVSSIEELKVFPNPAKEIALISFSNPERKSVSIQICTGWGNMIASRISDSNTLIKEEFNIQDLPSGIYLVNVLCGNKVYSQKLIKS